VADLAEIRAMIESALPGAEVEVVDETGGGDHLRAIVTAPQF
jgi:stress-induced morphogen